MAIHAETITDVVLSKSIITDNVAPAKGNNKEADEYPSKEKIIVLVEQAYHGPWQLVISPLLWKNTPKYLHCIG